MSKEKGAVNMLVRFLAIDARIRQRPAPTLTQLQEAAATALYGHKPHVRTIQNDIKRLRYHSGLRFYAPIKYSAAKRGYIYTEPDYTILEAIKNR